MELEVVRLEVLERRVHLTLQAANDASDGPTQHLSQAALLLHRYRLGGCMCCDQHADLLDGFWSSLQYS